MTAATARATVTRRLCTIAGFCKYAVGEELLDHSPAARPLPAAGLRVARHRPGGNELDGPAGRGPPS